MSMPIKKFPQHCRITARARFPCTLRLSFPRHRRQTALGHNRQGILLRQSEDECRGSHTHTHAQYLMRCTHAGRARVCLLCNQMSRRCTRTLYHNMQMWSASSSSAAAHARMRRHIGSHFAMSMILYTGTHTQPVALCYEHHQYAPHTKKQINHAAWRAFAMYINN